MDYLHPLIYPYFPTYYWPIDYEYWPAVHTVASSYRTLDVLVEDRVFDVFAEDRTLAVPRA